MPNSFIGQLLFPWALKAPPPPAAPQAERLEIVVGDRSLTAELVRRRGARRYTVRLGPDRVVRVSLPQRGSRRQALDFLAKCGPWLERRLKDLAETTPEHWTDGTPVWWRGERHPLRLDGAVARLGPLTFAVGRDLRKDVEAALRRVASGELPVLTLQFAEKHGLRVQRVGIRAQRSRWGSCSARGVISLNWRLVQTPEFVRDYIILHELAHLVEMNHSDRFWAVVERLCPGWREAERWLRRNGRQVLG